MLDIDVKEARLAQHDDQWTAREIAQQPEMLRQTHALIAAQSADLAAFVEPFCANSDARIILTGAGTSAFIGDCLAPYLNHALAACVEAIATTDIVAAPQLFLTKDRPTLLVSFGRSGNSPESKAAIDLADRFITDVRHLIITCNSQGVLATMTRGDDYVLILPEATHDRGFAMTSSFTSMTYAALSALTSVETLASRIDGIASGVANAHAACAAMVEDLVAMAPRRVVYLGGHVFKGLAKEAALKLMELTDGQVVAISETPLGFRHGPKTFIDDRTLVVMFVSSDPYARQYEIDLLDELRADLSAARVVAISAKSLDRPDTFRIDGLDHLPDVDLLFPYIVLPQVLALKMSMAHDLIPDRPSRSGTVNRVVQGVTIHAVEPS